MNTRVSRDGSPCIFTLSGGWAGWIQHKPVHLVQYVILLIVFRYVKSIVLVVDRRRVSDHCARGFRRKPVCPDQGINRASVGIDSLGRDSDLVGVAAGIAGICFSWGL